VGTTHCGMVGEYTRATYMRRTWLPVAVRGPDQRRPKRQEAVAGVHDRRTADWTSEGPAIPSIPTTTCRTFRTMWPPG
jgi:hypothetical protein